MKLQLLLLACLFALSSALAARRPSRLASGLSSSRDNHGLTARDDFDYCDTYGWCWECDSDERCRTDYDCNYDDDDDREYCINGYCCESEDKYCGSHWDCDDDDDDD